MNLEVNVLDVENADRAVVRLRVKGDEKSQYNFEASYLLLLQLEPDDDDETGPEQLQHQLAVTGATMLMPMVRECIANLTMRGRFGALWLPPINFAERVQTPPDPGTEATPKAKRSGAKKKKTK